MPEVPPGDRFDVIEAGGAGRPSTFDKRLLVASLILLALTITGAIAVRAKRSPDRPENSNSQPNDQRLLAVDRYRFGVLDDVPEVFFAFEVLPSPIDLLSPRPVLDRPSGAPDLRLSLLPAGSLTALGSTGDAATPSPLNAIRSGERFVVLIQEKIDCRNPTSPLYLTTSSIPIRVDYRDGDRNKTIRISGIPKIDDESLERATSTCE